MTHFPQDLLQELRLLVSQLGEDGSLSGPSVYDTAQVLRLCPPREGVQPGLTWLLTQQHPDGGWGVPNVPAGRDVPTLAAVLALHTHRDHFPAAQAVTQGLDFLRRQASQWHDIHIDILPVGVELILPYLLKEAGTCGIEIDAAPYARLIKLQQAKLRFLATHPPAPNTAPTFSWEALGLDYDPAMFADEWGVSLNPAATAAWAHQALHLHGDEARYARAAAYLARAAAHTPPHIPGVMPFGYPVPGFEVSYGLFPLYLTGLLTHPTLTDVVTPKIAELANIVQRQNGLGMAGPFIPDADCTSVAVALMAHGGFQTDLQVLQQFWNNNHFYTYPYELNPSLLTNAHVLHALAEMKKRCPLTEQFLLRRQTAEGRWMMDKWHTSWRALTMDIIAVMARLGYMDEAARGVQSLIADQNADGSWGHPAYTRMIETSYGLIGLLNASQWPTLAAYAQPAFRRAQQWLTQHLHERHTIPATWVGKEIFAMPRIDGIYVLSAALALQHNSLPNPAAQLNRVPTPAVTEA